MQPTSKSVGIVEIALINESGGVLLEPLALSQMNYAVATRLVPKCCEACINAFPPTQYIIASVLELVDLQIDS